MTGGAINRRYSKALRRIERLHNQVDESPTSCDALDKKCQCCPDLFDKAPDGYLITDLSGNIREANHSASILLGVDKRSLIDTPLIAFIAEEDKQSFNKNLTCLLQGHAVPNWETSMKPRNGETIQIALSVNCINDSIGQLVGLRWIFYDITERRRIADEFELEVRKRTAELAEANRALKLSEKRFSELVELLPDIIYETDNKSNITYANQSAFKFFGYSPEEFPHGLHMAQFLADGELERIQEALDTVAHGHPPNKSTYRMKRKDGSTFFCEITIAPIRDEEGNLIGFRGIVHDITKRKQFEEQLQRARDMADVAVRAKSQFLANMSHELRTPMNAVIGSTSMLLSMDLPAEEREYIEIIRDSGNSLLAVIDNILNLSKIEKGEIWLEIKPFNLRKCVDKAIDLIAESASEKGLHLEYTIDINVSEMIMGDPTKLRQILVNLLDNAIKFTNKGNVSLSISCKGNRSNELHFIIKDAGIGIPRDYMDRLFQPFSQADMSNTRRYGGSGISLVICKRFVDMMQGKIWVESELGKGSAFHFTIQAEAASN